MKIVFSVLILIGVMAGCNNTEQALESCPPGQVACSSGCSDLKQNPHCGHCDYWCDVCDDGVCGE